MVDLVLSLILSFNSQFLLLNPVLRSKGNLGCNDVMTACIDPNGPENCEIRV